MLSFYKIEKGVLLTSRGLVMPDGYETDWSKLEAKEDGTHYTYYLDEMVDGKYVADTEAEANAILDKEKQDAKAYLEDTDWVEAYDIKNRLGIDIIPEDSSKWDIIKERAKCRELLK